MHWARPRDASMQFRKSAEPAPVRHRGFHWKSVAPNSEENATPDEINRGRRSFRCGDIRSLRAVAQRGSLRGATTGALRYDRRGRCTRWKRSLSEVQV